MKTSFSFSPRIGFACALILNACVAGHSAQPGLLDPNFNATSIVGEMGFALAVQSDGKVIASGTFGLKRFLSDGSVDDSFQSAARGTHGYLVLQRDGRLLVSGNFTDAHGTALPLLLRLQSDGSLDPTFNLDPGVYPSGSAIALQADGKVLTGGLVTDPGDESYSGLIRLRPDGSLDPEFDRTPYSGLTDFGTLIVGSDGRIYTGGLLAVQPDGKVLVGGYGDGPDFRALRRYLPDGTEDPEWMPPAFGGGDHTITALLLQPDGKVIVAGNNLQGINGVGVANVGRLRSDGSLDTTFDSRPETYYYNPAALAFAPDGKIYVAGQQNIWPNLDPGPGVWRLYNDTTLQPQLRVTFNATDGITLTLSGYVGARYQIEYREQANTGTWNPLTTLTLSGPTATWQDSGWANSTTRFYRAVFVP